MDVPVVPTFVPGADHGRRALAPALRDGTSIADALLSSCHMRRDDKRAWLKLLVPNPEKLMPILPLERAVQEHLARRQPQ
jgi:hypothetical protein